MTPTSLPTSSNPIALATHRQRAAANPDVSAWVDASAGSGKTRVLTDRVLRLLVRGVPPHQILCLTFTKAAAANMANRLADELKHWARLPDEALAARLLALTGTPPEEEEKEEARQLFARILDAPGGMQFLTIHSFCQSLLARFPLEAGVPVGFNVLDERASTALLREAEERVLAGQMGAVNRLLALFDQEAFRSLLDAIVTHRGKLTQALAAHGGAALAGHIVRESLGVTLDENEETAAEALRACIPYDTMREALPHLAAGKDTDQKLGKKWAAFLTNRSSVSPLVESVYTADFSGFRKSPYTKDIAKAFPAIESLLGELQDCCARYLEKIRCLTTARATGDFLAVSEHLLEEYRRLKVRHVALDFDDLIERAQNLLRTSGSAWVLYKLDGGLSHVLVDEAQDTNAAQWHILEGLTGDFFTGETARSERTPARTIFAVGDYKQSIYSFQGANPDSFLSARGHFEAQINAVGQRLEKQEFFISFRSAQGVLDAVNAVFADKDASNGLGEVFPRHIAAKENLPAEVEVWPLAVKPPDSAEDETGQISVAPPPSPIRRLAQALAERLADMKAQEGLREGDVLVLVRTRSRFIGEFARACKARGLAIAGADRMILTEQLAVEDVLAVLQVLLLPEDDLSLACVLKSPFVGMSEERLFALCRDRKESLWARVQREEPTIKDWFYALFNRADFVTPYALVAGLLNDLCPAGVSGRKAMLSRLGADALDPLDELLSVALAFEQDETPTLQRFLAWLMESETEVKREMEHSGSAIRLMTVHGSKGLEAPVVILADSCHFPKDKNTVLFDPDDASALPYLAPSTKDEAKDARLRREALREKARAEYRRLLYVALTRAERKLFVVGWSGQKKSVTKTPEKEKADEARAWFDLVQAGLVPIGAEIIETGRFPCEDGWKGELLRYRVTGEEQKNKTEKAPVPFHPPTLPHWATTPPAPEPVPCVPLSPSKLFEDGEEPPVVSPLGTEDKAWTFRRGTLVHRLLQMLPEMEATRRLDVGLRWLIAQAVPEKQAAALMDEVLCVLTHPDFAKLFGQESRAEVSISGHVGQKLVVGTIDRLAVVGDKVWLVDYKTNRTVPKTVEAIPRAYLRQLAAYRAVLRGIYTGKQVRAVLLWTHGALLMDVPDEVLAQHEP